MIARPGKIPIQGAWRKKPRPSESIRPQLGSGGWVPRPKNDRAAPTPAQVAVATDPGPFRAAAVEHLEGSEALLTVVRSDARDGGLDPQLRSLAKGMLTQTRLFLDASEGGDPELRRIMEDLELVLAQIVAVDQDGSRTRTELELALDGLEDREVLSRIQTLSGAGLAGT